MDTTYHSSSLKFWPIEVWFCCYLKIQHLTFNCVQISEDREIGWSFWLKPGRGCNGLNKTARWKNSDSVISVTKTWHTEKSVKIFKRKHFYIRYITGQGTGYFTFRLQTLAFPWLAADIHVVKSETGAHWKVAAAGATALTTYSSFYSRS